MSLTASERHRNRAIGLSWLGLGVPVGALLGWVLQISDSAQDRRFGWFLLVLAVLSLVLGLTLVRWTSPRLRVISLGASCLWVMAAGLAVVLADFPTDRLWGGGLTGLVAVVTGTLALLSRRPRRAP